MQHHLKTRCGAVVCSCEVSGTDRADSAMGGGTGSCLWEKEGEVCRPGCECKESGWNVRLYPVEVGARGFVGRSASCMLKDLGLRGATLSRSTKELSEEVKKASHWLWLKRWAKAWGVTSNSVLLQGVSGRRPCSLPRHLETFWVKGRNVSEQWSPAEDSAAKPLGMRSGLGLPQGRGRPCHAQSTTGTLRGQA